MKWFSVSQNSNLGNDKPVEINFGDESSILEYWDNDLPLKVITHGWSDDKNSGVFNIKTGTLFIDNQAKHNICTR